MKSLALIFYQGVVCAFLILTPYLKRFVDQPNRFFLPWYSYQSLVGTVALLGALLGGGLWFFRCLSERWKKPGLERLSLAGLLAFSVFLATRTSEGRYFSDPWVWDLVLGLCLVLLVALSWWGDRNGLSRLCRGTLVVLGPVALVVVIQFMVSFSDEVPPPPTAESLRSLPQETVPGDLPSVYLLLFDSWSYQEVFKEGEVLDRYPHLQALSRQSTLYHEAHAPARHTWYSMPQILYQRKIPFYEWRDHKLDFFKRTHEKFPQFKWKQWEKAFKDEDNLFSRPHALGYRTAALGGYDYALTVSKDLDLPYRSIGQRNVRSWLHDAVTDLILGLTLHLRWNPTVSDTFGWDVIKSQRRMWEIWEIHGVALDWMEHYTEPLFALFHYPLPHYPFLFNRQGFKGFRINASDFHENYRQNVDYLDTLVGELVATLKKNGRFDRSILVLLSDHSARDPKTGQRTTHVPLIIKAVGQEERKDVHERIGLESIEPLLRRLYEPEGLPFR